MVQPKYGRLEETQRHPIKENLKRFSVKEDQQEKITGIDSLIMKTVWLYMNLKKLEVQ